MKLIEGFDSNYRYILVAARRARQIQSGARPLIETPLKKPCKVAQEEIKQGILRGLEILKPEQMYIDPDCGLKTRTVEEAKEKLAVMVAAVREVREERGITA
jgi:DNA-directed RNA polymerase omega subunit